MYSLESNDSIADVHVLSRLETSQKSAIDVGVVVEQDPAEVLEVQYSLGLAILLEGDDEATQFCLVTESFLLVRGFVCVPSMQHLECLGEEARKMLRFVCSTLEEQSCQLVLFEKLMNEVHQTEARCGVVMHQLQHQEREVCID